MEMSDTPRTDAAWYDNKVTFQECYALSQELEREVESRRLAQIDDASEHALEVHNLTVDRDRAIAALIKFGNHSDGCALRDGNSIDECTCGFDQAAGIGSSNKEITK
jgi:hypothetical protein